MAEINLTKFKDALADGARPNRFWVSITSPVGATWSDPDMGFLVKSFSIPAETIGEIIVNYQGLQTKIAGDPTFDDVTMTLHNDYALKAKSFFEKWLSKIVSIGTTGENVRTAPAEYKTTIVVQQLGRAGETLRTYTLVGAYPKQMDAIELSMETTDTLEEMSISFGYDTFSAE